jgi:hypothetical protein
MTEFVETIGFTSPVATTKIAKQRHLGIELLATVALAVCLIIAATAVSIGMARAQVLHVPVLHVPMIGKSAR